jgi:VWFA-related protein
MRTRTVALAAALLVSVPLAAQMRESIEVSLVEIEVSVIDRAGRAVTGLTEDDFEVFIGRRAVPIASFYQVSNGRILADNRTAVPAATSNAVAPATSIPTSLVIFIDELHLSQRSHKRTIEALKKYVAGNVGPSTSATLVRYRGELNVRVRPTEKPGYILAELDRIGREPVGDESVRERKQMIQLIDDIFFSQSSFGKGKMWELTFQQLQEYAEGQAREVDRTIAAIKEAVELTSMFAGRKVLLYVSDGLPQEPAADMFDYWDRCARLSPFSADVKFETSHMNSSESIRYGRIEEFRKAVQAAQQAGVAIYSFDAGGARGYEDRGAESATTRARFDTMLFQSNQRGGLQYIAAESGGMYVANENDIDKLLGRMSEQFTSYYSIAVRPRRGDIAVKVKNRPELRIFATRRRPPRTKEETLEQDVRRRLYTRDQQNPLSAKLDIGTPARLKGDCVVPVRVMVAEPALQPQLKPELLDMRVVMLNENNDESAMQRVGVPVVPGRTVQSMMLRVRPEHQVLSLSVSNPLSGESSFLQGDIDGSTCR